MRAWGWMAALAMTALPGVVAAQTIDFDAPAKTKSFVMFEPEQEMVTAGKRSEVELRFHVVDGFHVNSHTPKSELLIATQLTLESADGVVLGKLVYPAGVPYSLSVPGESKDAAEKLDVYAGLFTVKVPVVAKAGSHMVAGTLRYQACDRAACYPPKTLAVKIPIEAR